MRVPAPGAQSPQGFRGICPKLPWSIPQVSRTGTCTREPLAGDRFCSRGIAPHGAIKGEKVPLTRNTLKARVGDQGLLLVVTLKSFCCLQLEGRISTAGLKFVFLAGCRSSTVTEQDCLPQPSLSHHATTFSHHEEPLRRTKICTRDPGSLQGPQSKQGSAHHLLRVRRDQPSRQRRHPLTGHLSKLKMPKIKPNSTYQPGPLSQGLVQQARAALG